MSFSKLDLTFNCRSEDSLKVINFLIFHIFTVNPKFLANMPRGTGLQTFKNTTKEELGDDLKVSELRFNQFVDIFFFFRFVLIKRVA